MRRSRQRDCTEAFAEPGRTERRVQGKRTKERHGDSPASLIRSNARFP